MNKKIKLNQKVAEGFLIATLIICIIFTYIIHEKNTKKAEASQTSDESYISEALTVAQTVSENGYEKKVGLSKELYLNYQVVESSKILNCNIGAFSSNLRETKKYISSHISAKLNSYKVSKVIDKDIYNNEYVTIFDKTNVKIEEYTIVDDYSFITVEYTIDNLSAETIYFGTDIAKINAIEEFDTYNIKKFYDDSLNFKGSVACFYRKDSFGDKKESTAYFEFNPGENMITACYMVPDKMIETNKLYLCIGLNGSFNGYQNDSGMIHLDLSN